jgi:hypothetical protein
VRPFTSLGLLAVPGLLALVCWQARPYRLELARVPGGIAPRTPTERHNLAEAIRRLNGAVLVEQTPWSLDRHLGTRTLAGGYLPAPTLRGGSRELEPGGGLCQLASAIFQASLLAGLEIRERHAHGRSVSSALPGLDATLKEGVRDLVVVNRGPGPVRLGVTFRGEAFVVTLSGLPGRAGARLLTRELARDPAGTRLIETSRWRREAGEGPWSPDWTDTVSQRR